MERLPVGKVLSVLSGETKTQPHFSLHSSSDEFQYLRPEQIAALSVRELRNYKGAAFQHWRSRGFPYPNLSTSELEQRYSQFARSRRSVFGPGRSITWSPLGLGLANFFHPHMWEIECQYFRSPLLVFQDDTLY